MALYLHQAVLSVIETLEGCRQKAEINLCVHSRSVLKSSLSTISPLREIQILPIDIKFKPTKTSQVHTIYLSLIEEMYRTLSISTIVNLD
jgi:hypothetical protein